MFPNVYCYYHAKWINKFVNKCTILADNVSTIFLGDKEQDENEEQELLWFLSRRRLFGRSWTAQTHLDSKLWARLISSEPALKRSAQLRYNHDKRGRAVVSSLARVKILVRKVCCGQSQRLAGGGIESRRRSDVSVVAHVLADKWRNYSAIATLLQWLYQGIASGAAVLQNTAILAIGRRLSVGFPTN